ncbi:Stealth-like protein [Pseudomonas putida]|uniref:stealth conserved region 3 domain-containing protein n=1 Tax=Pseudomonas putida TaxID=303 RepID=UPI0010433A41|nr:stealth conserved region 3 domain-containing protein [Pseudomonas putida]TCP75532.1 Stealth-like protein [Pseudomonas putida]
MTKKQVKYKKLRKFFRDPNLFFYDMFRKRVFQNSPQTAVKTSLPSANRNNVDLMEVNRLGLKAYLRESLKAGIGAEDGNDPNSLVLWSGYLNGLINFISGIKEATPTDVCIYTLGGSVSIQSPAKSKLNIAEVSSSLTARPNFVVEFSNDLGLSEIIQFYLYDLDPAGMANVRSSKAHVKRFAVKDLDSIYGGRSQRSSDKIDAVYTWVNHVDPIWQALWKESFPEAAFDPDRYTNNDELKFSLRSLHKYAPWLNNIYIVSNCGKPDWLADDPRIIWVDHIDIFPDSNVLPTFNSHAIEASLHLIPGLSEKFIYLNDDFVLSQPCLPSDFFDEVGRSLSYFEPYGMVTGRIDSESPDYLIAASNVCKLLKPDFPSYTPRTLHRHVPYALRKSVLQELEQRYTSAFVSTRAAKTRSADDINLTSFLYHHFAYITGAAVRADASGIIARPNNIDVITTKASYKYKFICFNDGNGSSEDQKYKKVVNDFFGIRLAKRAPWERVTNNRA